MKRLILFFIVLLVSVPMLAWGGETDQVDQEKWRRRYCPVCGGNPDIAYLDTERGSRWLVCSLAVEGGILFLSLIWWFLLRREIRKRRKAERKKEALIEELQDHWLPKHLTRIHVSSSGSEGNESAIKIARQYHYLNGEPKRSTGGKLRK